MIIASIVGSVTLLFFLWKRLKEDYHFERIFNLGVSILVGVAVAVFLSNWFFKGFWFWWAMLGLMGGYLIGRIRQRISFFESFEAVVAGSLAWLSLFYLSDSVVNSSLYSFLAFWVTLCMIVLFFFLDGNYKKIGWYTSGRVGFAGLAVGMIYFLIRTVVSLAGFSVMSSSPVGEGLISGLTTVVFMVLLYNLRNQ